MERLSPETLSRLPASVTRPAGKRPAGLRIVHLGLGAFARAHLAAYTQDANAKAGTDWQIVGVSLQRPDMRDTLQPQSGLYTLVTRAPDGPQRALIDVVTGVLVAPENPVAVVDLLADPATRIVTLTVTEKGYCFLPATGKLNSEHPDILHDLAHREAPRSVPGFLTAGLSRRRTLGLAPFTVLSCDNIPSNGHVLRGLVLEFAERVDPALAAWIRNEVAFPCCMVDRIVPATTPADIVESDAVLGLHDANPVMGEPFRQWAIEDHFVSGRPAWEKAGAEMVAEVAPYEFMKLRMLNGTHSCLAYLGYLAGHETVADATNDPLIAGYLERLWAEIIPTVPLHRAWSLQITPAACWSAIATRPFAIGPGKSPWMARRSCRSACSEPCAGGSSAASPRLQFSSVLPGGCATPRGRTRRASRSTSATRSPRASPGLPLRPMAMLPRWRGVFWRSKRCSAPIFPPATICAALSPLSCTRFLRAEHGKRLRIF